MRLLLLEDEAAIRSALARAMQRWGHTVVTAADLAEARVRATEHRPEALVSDLKLPDGSSLQLARELALPFVLMSGYAAFDDAVEALRLGCVDFLTKPVALDVLRGSLERLAERLNGWECCVIEMDQADASLTLLRPRAEDFSRQTFQVLSATWADPGQAREAYARLLALAPGIRQRQVLAEILQSTSQGRIVVNAGPTWWRIFAQVSVDWDDAVGRDRHLLIAGLAHRVIRRPNGLIVECLHHPGPDLGAAAPLVEQGVCDA